MINVLPKGSEESLRDGHCHWAWTKPFTTCDYLRFILPCPQLARPPASGLSGQLVSKRLHTEVFSRNSNNECISSLLFLSQDQYWWYWESFSSKSVWKCELEFVTHWLDVDRWATMKERLKAALCTLIFSFHYMWISSSYVELGQTHSYIGHFK